MKVSLAGCGRWGRNILRDLLSLGLEVCVADPDPDARSRAEAAGAHQVVSELDELPLSAGTIIATPTSTHFAVTERALKRGVPVFVEKPMTNNASDARVLADRGEGLLFVMDKWRYHPGIAELRRICETEELGRPLRMRLLHAGWGQPHQDVDVSWILLPHSLSIFLEVFGIVPEPRYAFAERTGGLVSGLVGVLGQGPQAVVEISARSPQRRREFQLHCEHGVAWLDDGWSDSIRIARGDELSGSGGDAPAIERRSARGELPLLGELRAFVKHLHGGPAPRSSAREGALIVERIHQLRCLAGVES